MAEVFPYSFAPKGWADCQGQILPISQYSALFSLLGINYGGNGTTTFCLPDLQGRVAVGMGALPGGETYSLGDMGGTETVTLDPSALPPHAHALNATQAEGSVNTPGNNLLATVFKGDFTEGARGNIYSPDPADTTFAAASIELAGGGGAHANVQPSLALRYCIALVGVFPQRP